MRLSSERCGTQRCSICGGITETGARWIGSGVVITVCSEEECARALVHAAYEALTDCNGVNTRLLVKEWRMLTDEPLRMKSRGTNYVRSLDLRRPSYYV